jgi:hypothetical protein
MIAAICASLNDSSATTPSANNAATSRFADVTMTASGKPINEFGDNNLLYYCTFPDLFPLGTGLHFKGSVPANVARHMFDQFHSFPYSTPFLFAIFNQNMRHACARAVSARLRWNTDAVDDFNKAVEGGDLPRMLAAAADDPFSEEAQTFHTMLGRHVEVCGGRVSYSPLSRQQAQSFIG